MAARPKTLWAAVAPVIIGIALAAEAGGMHIPFALAALFGAVMIQIGTNLANDYFDYKKGTDQPGRLGPTRVTQAGLVTPRAMRKAIAVAFGLAVLAGIYLVWRGGWPIVAVGLLSILFGLLYTAGPYPLSYNGLGDIFVLIFFGPVAVGGTYYVQTLDINATVLIAGLAPGLFSVAILTVNNLRDIKTDADAGKKTLQVRLGQTFARLEYLVSIVIACFIPPVLYFFSGQHPYALLVLLVLPAAVPAIRKVFVLSETPKLNDVLAATGKLLLLYAVLFSVGWLL